MGESTDSGSKRNLRIAVLYICTGKYSMFWNDFYTSSNRYFNIGAERHYFVFTDSKEIEGKDVTVIYREHAGFPMDSLLRFEMFLSIEVKLAEYDFVFFFNSNMVFAREVNGEIMPTEGKDLVGVLHPGLFRRSSLWYPYERNKLSMAYVERNNIVMRYFMGSLIGGTSKAFLELCRTCAEWIAEDFRNEIIAIFHDESHLNKYFATRDILILDPGYAYPEGWILPFQKKIMIVDKVKQGGIFFSKQSGKSLFKRMQCFTRRLVSGLFWYIRI
jgi:hypothetical protein